MIVGLLKNIDVENVIMFLILEIFSQNFTNFLSLDKKLIFSNQIHPSSL